VIVHWYSLNIFPLMQIELRNYLINKVSSQSLSQKSKSGYT
jgi:hypothetical protein